MRPDAERRRSGSENLQRNGRTRLGIGQGVVVTGQIESAGRRDRMKLMVGKPAAEDPPRRTAGAVEPVAGPGHAVEFEDGAQTPLVERRIVRHQRQPLDPQSHLAPHLGEIGRLDRIVVGQPVDGRGKGAVIIGARTDQTVKRIRHRAAAHDDDAHRANARTLAVGRLEIYGCEIGHFPVVFTAGPGARDSPASPSRRAEKPESASDDEGRPDSGPRDKNRENSRTRPPRQRKPHEKIRESRRFDVGIPGRSGPRRPLPVHRRVENLVIGGILRRERRPLVLHAEHRERLGAVVAHGAHALRSHAHHAPFADRENPPVHLEFAPSGQKEVELLVRLVPVQESGLGAGSHELKGEIAAGSPRSRSAENLARNPQPGSRLQHIIAQLAEPAHFDGREMFRRRDRFDSFHHRCLFWFFD